MGDDKTQTPRVILVRSEVSPKYVICEACKAYYKFRRHPSEGTGECRRYAPKGVTEPLGGFTGTYRAKWPIVFRDEGCFDGLTRGKGGNH